MEYLPMAVRALIPIGGIALVAVIVWATERRKEREAFYRAELLRKIAESPGAAAQSVLEMIRQEGREAEIRRREGLKLGGLITTAVGLGLMIVLAVFRPVPLPTWAIGLIPLMVGAVLVGYVYFLPPRNS